MSNPASMEPDSASLRTEVKFDAASDKMVEAFRQGSFGLGSTGPSGRQFRAAKLKGRDVIQNRRMLSQLMVIYRSCICNLVIQADGKEGSFFRYRRLPDTLYIPLYLSSSTFIPVLI